MQATTASLVFKAAHAAAKVANAVVAYRTRFTTALRAAWAAAKQTIKSVMKTQTNEFQITVFGIVYDCVIWNKVAGKERIYIKDNDAFRAKKYGADFAQVPFGDVTPANLYFLRKGPFGDYRAPMAAALVAALEMIAPVAPAATAAPAQSTLAPKHTCWSCGGSFTRAEVLANGGDWMLDGCECGC